MSKTQSLTPNLDQIKKNNTVEVPKNNTLTKEKTDEYEGYGSFSEMAKDKNNLAEKVAKTVTDE